MKILFFLAAFFVSITCFAQYLFAARQQVLAGSTGFAADRKKLYQRNYGAILGIQRGSNTAVEMGGEMHWRKMALRKPRITGLSANLEYNFGNHVLGYKIGAWQKTGRVNLTYGGNVVYFTNFKGLQRYGVGPAVGFRLAGFHLINGYNILFGDKELDDVNTLYMSLRYYFPISNKFTWDRKTRQRKRERKEAIERGERWNWKQPFKLPKKKD